MIDFYNFNKFEGDSPKEIPTSSTKKPSQSFDFEGFLIVKFLNRNELFIKIYSLR